MNLRPLFSQPLFLVLALALLTSACASVTPAARACTGGCNQSPLASTSALLSYLTALAGQSQHILIGQHTSYWDHDPMDVVNAVQERTGKSVAVLGTTVGQVGSAEDVVGLSNAWIARGGLVLVSLWPVNPFTGVDDNTRNGFTFSDIYTPGTPLNTRWNRYLDGIAAKLRDIRGPYLFRPFVELDGNWSWWGARPTSQMIALWQYSWQRLVQTDGVHNALWVYNVNYGEGNYAEYYPGKAFVDVVSLDAYPPLAGDAGYAALVQFQQPLILAEVGVQSSNNDKVQQFSGDNTQLLDTVKRHYPQAVAVVLFCQHWAIPVQNGAAALMNDPAVLTLSDLPKP